MKQSTRSTGRFLASMAAVLLLTATPAHAKNNKLQIECMATDFNTMISRGGSIVVAMTNTGSENLVAWKVIPLGKMLMIMNVQWDTASFSWYQSTSSLKNIAGIKPSSSVAVEPGTAYAWTSNGFEKTGSAAAGTYVLTNQSDQAAVFGLMNAGIPATADVIAPNASLTLQYGNLVSVFMEVLNAGQVAQYNPGHQLEVSYTSATSHTVMYNPKTGGFDLEN